MSQTDPHEASGASADAPIVLIVQAGDAQSYLDDNPTLEALYGHLAPMRFVARWSWSDVGMRDAWFRMHLYPNLEDPYIKLSLAEQFDVKLSDLPELISSERYYRAVFDFLLELSGMVIGDTHRVKAVVSTVILFGPAMPLRAVMARYFPGATALSIAEDGKGKTSRIELN